MADLWKEAYDTLFAKYEEEKDKRIAAEKEKEAYGMLAEKMKEHYDMLAEERKEDYDKLFVKYDEEKEKRLVVEKKMVAVEEKLDALITSTKIQNAKLKVRPRIEKLERDVIPEFLLISTNFSENVKWRISLYFELTPRASILRTEILDRGLTIEAFANAMTLAYRSSSEYISHDKTPSQILLSAVEWEVLFKDLNIFDQVVKDSVKLCVDDSLYKPQKRNLTKPSNVFDFLVYVKYLSITDDHGQNEIQEEIKEICKTAILSDAGNKILDENFLFICNSRTPIKVEVLFLINNVTYNDMKPIKEELLKMKGSCRIVTYWKVSHLRNILLRIL